MKNIQDFYHDFRQNIMAGSEANSAFSIQEFMELVSYELMETGFIEGFDFCHYRTKRGMRVDGYRFNDEDKTLALFIADFEGRDKLESLSKTDVISSFKRVANFLKASAQKDLFAELEETSPEYGLARQISDQKELIDKVNFFLVSERALSDRLQSLEDSEIAGIPVSYHVWDISRIQRQRNSRGHKEALDIDFVERFGDGIPCLQAHRSSGTYESYLAVVPGEVLASLYEEHGARLLEKNVRAFLQARGKVNKGIRNTILHDPSKFFSYNNGITATAQRVAVEQRQAGFQITRIVDFQIVNGGQTTASLFHTRRKDDVPLCDVFIQMKLSVVDDEKESEDVVSRISEYANTQNRVNPSDFFSNHPFHRRIEEFSRRIWAPARQGAQRETKWFYERARGQYADAQSKLTPRELRRFRAEHPRPQMFTKTDLAKFENTWEDHPKWVNLGAQKNFVQFAVRIDKEWLKTPTDFNENYFKTLIARAIIFRRTEKMISEQAWYQGGYRANIVAYTIAVINACCRNRKRTVNFRRIWDTQEVHQSLLEALTAVAKFVSNEISDPPPGISNISEWCKKDACWSRLEDKLPRVEKILPKFFWDELVSSSDFKEERSAAKSVQKIDDGIAMQKHIYGVPKDTWSKILAHNMDSRFLSEKEIDIVKIALRMPQKIPTEKQCTVLAHVLAKAKDEGVIAS